MNQADIDRRRAELERELLELDDEEQLLGSLTPAQQLAEGLHDMQCHLNHTDMCGWFYDNWTDRAGNRQRWVDKADAVLAELGDKYSIEELLHLAKLFKG